MPPQLRPRKPLQQITPNSSKLPDAALEDSQKAHTRHTVKIAKGKTALAKIACARLARPGKGRLRHAGCLQAVRRRIHQTRTKQKWFHRISHPDHEIENLKGINDRNRDSIRWCQGPYDHWLMGNIRGRFHRIPSFDLPKASSAAGKGSSLDTKIHRGDTVELNNGAFVRIRRIYQSHWLGPILFSGYLFERNLRLMGWLPRIENEVFWLWTFLKGKDPGTAKPLLVEAHQSDVRRKWNLRKARPRVPQYNSPLDKQSPVEQAQKNTLGRGTLVYRWKYVRVSTTMYRTQYNETFYEGSGSTNYEEKSLIAVAYTENHEDPNSSSGRRFCKQGSLSNPVSRKGDSHLKKHVTQSLDEGSENYLERSSTTADRPHCPDSASLKYTFGDAFAGCGGMSRAAEMAGLDVRWGFDKDSTEIAAYQTNFPSAHTWKTGAHEFVALGTDSELKIDVLHFSPPCQFFSSAHSREGRNDDMNTASLFSIPAVIKRTDPRVVTVEQVPNIMKGHPGYFSGLIQFFTCLGWSIRWKVINCVDFGVPQMMRRRLFLIGSRPGTVLPKFPVRTHVGPSTPISGGLQSWTTVADAIDHIPPGVSETTRPLPFTTSRSLWAAYDANSPHPTTVKAATTGAKSMCLPNGHEPLSIRELACLQSFPYEHQFNGSRNQKYNQIGNAVPPLVGQAILKEVRKSLTSTDLIHRDDDDDAFDGSPSDDAFYGSASDDAFDGSALDDAFDGSASDDA